MMFSFIYKREILRKIALRDKPADRNHIPLLIHADKAPYGIENPFTNDLASQKSIIDTTSLNGTACAEYIAIVAESGARNCSKRGTK